jgi:hypothetical protein
MSRRVSRREHGARPTGHEATGLPQHRVDPRWLALREPADALTRDRAAEFMLPPLLAQWAVEPDRALNVVDLGAGTGANLRWLAPRLPNPDRQRWTLVDHDPDLPAWGPVPATAVLADVADLATVLDGTGVADLVTAAALLDLLDGRRLSAIVDAVVAARVPALFSLTVTGEVTLDPPDPWDGPLAAAFDAHQRRDHRLGPDAGATAAALFRDRGWSTVEAHTPWLLHYAASSGDPGDTCDSALVAAWLAGRAEASAEERPDLGSEIRGWLARRRAQVADGSLTALVGHTDLVALPT